MSNDSSPTPRTPAQFRDAAAEAQAAEGARRRDSREKDDRDRRCQEAVWAFRDATDDLWSAPPDEARSFLAPVRATLLKAVQALADVGRLGDWEQTDHERTYDRFRVRNHREMSRPSYDWAREMFDRASKDELPEDLLVQTWDEKSLRDALRWLRIFVVGLSGEGATWLTKMQEPPTPQPARTLSDRDAPEERMQEPPTPQHLGAANAAGEEPASTAGATQEMKAGSEQKAMTGRGELPAPISPNRFARQSGNRILIVFGNKSETLPMLEGLRVVEFLLKQPGTAAHVLRINLALSGTHSRAATLEAAGARSEESQGLDGFTDDASWSPDPYSEEALRQAEEAVEGLDARAAEARKRGKCTEAERLENEAELAREMIRKQRVLATRKRRGQPDQAAAVEKVRVKLTNNLTNAYKALRTRYDLSELADHLEAQIGTGINFKYQPTPGIEWSFDPKPC
jgi:hypothetical protein